MSFMMPGRRKGGFARIKAALELKAASSQYLTRTPGVAGNRKKFTISTRIRKLANGVTQAWFSAGTSALDIFYFDSSDRLDMLMFGGSRLRRSNMVFRDPSAHYHFVVAVDTTPVTPTIRVWVNGVEITSWETSSNPAQNAQGNIGNTVVHYIGKDNSGEYCDCVGSDFHYIDDVAVTDATNFGAFDSAGRWVYKKYAGAHGAAGTIASYLDFANGADLGNDVSGNNNDWTPVGGPVQTLDTPTNVYARLDPLTNFGYTASGVVKDAGTRFYRNDSGHAGPCATIGVTSGLWYWEVAVQVISSGCGIGVCTDKFPFYQNLNIDSNAYIWGVLPAYGCYHGTGSPTWANQFGTPAAGDVFMFAVDATRGYLYIGFKGQWVRSNGTLGAWNAESPTYTGLAGTLFPVTRISYGDVIFKFGDKGFTYTPPTGFKALCTANLPKPAIANPGVLYQSVLATEANIVSSLATARSGWADYIDILKNRSTSESWAWRFSHDAANEYAVASGSVTRQATRALAGTDNWVGYSIRIGAAYGTAAGSVVHANGAASTVTHNLGNARALILLFPRAGGSVVRVYHPDLTAGSLLDLCSTAAQAADTTITSVTSNSFQIGSGTASGTYDYLVITDNSAVCLGKYIGNAAADGPRANVPVRPALLLAKDIAGAYSWYVMDDARPAFNPATKVVYSDLAMAEETRADTDFLANGFKRRSTQSGVNAANTHVYAAFARHPFGGGSVPPVPAR